MTTGPADINLITSLIRAKQEEALKEKKTSYYYSENVSATFLREKLAREDCRNQGKKIGV